MDYLSGEDSFFCEFKTLVSSFCGLLLRASRLQFPMQTRKLPRPVVLHPQFPFPGLKTLISDQEREENAPQVVRCAGVGIMKSMPLTHRSPFSTTSCSFMDDLIGTESGVCLTSNVQEIEKKSTQSDQYHRHINQDSTISTQTHRRAAKKPFPPPIPFVTVESGDPTSQTRTPWVLTRHYTNGRLILKLERVRHHEYLESHRENGRLVLKLVHVPVPNGNEEDDQDQDLQFTEEDGGEGEKAEAEEMESKDYEEAEEINKAAMESAETFKSFTYGGEGCGGAMFGDRHSFCFLNRKFEERHIDYGYFGSAPLRPMATVI